jgi:hypothetical protein
LVKTRLVPQGLQKAAWQSHGKYLLWNNAPQTADRVVRILAAGSRTNTRLIRVLAYAEYFPWLIGLAFCLLWLEWIIPILGRRAAA